MRLTTKSHTNSKYVRKDECSEGYYFREALRLQTKTNWRNGRGPKVEFDKKAKQQFLKDKREADKNFTNKTIVHWYS